MIGPTTSAAARLIALKYGLRAPEVAHESTKLDAEETELAAGQQTKTSDTVQDPKLGTNLDLRV
jgi:hypothetical protein